MPHRDARPTCHHLLRHKLAGNRRDNSCCLEKRHGYVYTPSTQCTLKLVKGPSVKLMCKICLQHVLLQKQGKAKDVAVCQHLEKQVYVGGARAGITVTFGCSDGP